MKKEKIIVLSSDDAVITPLKGIYDVDISTSSEQVIKKSSESEEPFIIIDSDTKGLKGMSLFKELKRLYRDARAIMISSSASIQEAVEAAKLGISDYIKKPFLSEKLLESVKKMFIAIQVPRISADRIMEAPWLLGGGVEIRDLLRNMEAAMHGKRHILFVAEDGIDVHVLAGLVHDFSGRPKKITAIDMLPYQRESSEGIFWTVLQEALLDSDTIYFGNFDQVSEKQRESVEGYIRDRAPRGGIKIIAGTRPPVPEKGYSDWEVVNVPALRDRKEDLPAIIRGCVIAFSRRYGRELPNVNLDALNMLMNYGWPGNYRELEGVIENAVLLCQDETISLREMQVNSAMLLDDFLSSQKERLRDFAPGIEKCIVDIFFKKTGSEEMTANLLDVPRSRISDILSNTRR